jgi:hypothetical protein
LDEQELARVVGRRARDASRVVARARVRDERHRRGRGRGAGEGEGARAGEHARRAVRRETREAALYGGDGRRGGCFTRSVDSGTMKRS